MIGGGCFACVGRGAGAGAAAGFEGGGGADMSKRSPIVLVVAGGFLADVGGDAADEKSPKALSMLSFREVVAAGCVGGDVCFGGGAGLGSKNEPPLSTPDFEDVCLVWPAEDVALAKPDSLG